MYTNTVVTQPVIRWRDCESLCACVIPFCEQIICTCARCTAVFEFCSFVLSTAPQISSWSICRLNYTAYSFTISVDSNGGAEIAHVNVSYRVAGTSSGWSPTLVSLNPPSEGLVLSGIVRSQEFTASSGPYEFQLSVVNGAYIWSALMERNETIGM